MRTTRLYTLLALLLMAGGVTIQAQEYESYFGADSTRLNVFEECIDQLITIPIVINNGELVNINGRDYYQGFPQGTQADHYYAEEFYFREDVATGRLYRYFPLHDEDEVLICDMSLTEGDTFEFTNTDGTFQVEVESVTFENGKKVIHLTHNWLYRDLVFCEGVFPNYYPMGYMDYFGCDNFLLCAYKDGEQVFVNQEFNDCYIDETSVQEQDLQQVSLYPNPAKEAVLIEGVKPAEVQLHNALGQLVKTVENTHEINVAGLPQGVYLLRIRDEEGKVFTAKLAVK